MCLSVGVSIGVPEDGSFPSGFSSAPLVFFSFSPVCFFASFFAYFRFPAQENTHANWGVFWLYVFGFFVYSTLWETVGVLKELWLEFERGMEQPFCCKSVSCFMVGVC